jgi:hypothetical protein
MTSARSDDCRSLWRGVIATATVEAPRRKRRRSQIPRALVRVPIQPGTMTSAGSDDCRSLWRGVIATATVEAPRRKRRRSRIPRALVRVPIQPGTMTPLTAQRRTFPLFWWETYALSRPGRAFSPVWWETYAPSAYECSLSGLRTGPFHAAGLHGREWHPGFQGGSWG